MTRRGPARTPGHSGTQDAKTLDLDAARGLLLDADAALGLGLTTAQRDALIGYAVLLQRWGRVFNLTALRGAEQVLTNHLSDCLAALPSLRRHAAGRALRILDVGSGAGLPGAVLAIAQPDWKVDCVDASAKKASFVRQVAVELGLRNLHSWHARVEDMPDDLPGSGRKPPGTVEERRDVAVPDRWRFDLIISRAFASLGDFVTLSGPLLAEGGAWVAMKANPSPAELAQLPPEVDLFHVEQLRVPDLDARRCLIWLRRRQRASTA